MIRIGRAFGMEVLAHDPRKEELLAEVLGFRYVALPELLAKATSSRCTRQRCLQQLRSGATDRGDDAGEHHVVARRRAAKSGRRTPGRSCGGSCAAPAVSRCPSRTLRSAPLRTEGAHTPENPPLALYRRRAVERKVCAMPAAPHQSAFDAAARASAPASPPGGTPDAKSIRTSLLQEATEYLDARIGRRRSLAGVSSPGHEVIGPPSRVIVAPRVNRERAIAGRMEAPHPLGDLSTPIRPAPTRLGMYVSMWLDRGRSLSRILGDEVVRGQVETQPSLLAQLAADPLVRQAQERQEFRHWRQGLFRRRSGGPCHDIRSAARRYREE